MADEGGADFSVVNAFGRSSTGRRFNPFAPGCGSASKHPFEDAAGAVRHGGHAVARIEKMFAVEVVGAGSAIKWHLGLGCVISPWRRSPWELWAPNAIFVSYLRRTRLSYGTLAQGANERAGGDADRNADGNLASGGRKRDERLCGASCGWRTASRANGISRSVWGERAYSRRDGKVCARRSGGGCAGIVSSHRARVRSGLL